MIVDASAMIEVLLQTAKARTVQAHLHSSDGKLDAPHLIDVEVAQVLRRFALHGALAPDRAAAALDALAQFPLRRHPHTRLLSRVWLLRTNLSAYDAIYVALAEALDAPLVTCDVRLAHAAGAAIEVLVA